MTKFYEAQWYDCELSELEELKQGAYNAFREAWGNDEICMRHFMNLALFVQIEAMLRELKNTNWSTEYAQVITEADFLKGYLFGLVADYCDVIKVAPHSDNARQAFFDVFSFVYGREIGLKKIIEETKRQNFSHEYEQGMLSVREDINVLRQLVSNQPVQMKLI